ncbi:unnamed protein product [Larinioides sclopetarius]|uniref:Reticulocyte-binding protein 2-like protein a n=1 Tax=Larinioides sclopetarius TaxID=280406 RepID=A0AAV1Z4Z2_9ARAC
MSRSNRPPPKDMYWFAHGGPESDSSTSQRSVAQVEEDEGLSSNSPTWNLGADRKGSPEESRGLLVTDGSSSSGPSSLERDDRLRIVDKRLAVEERRKQLWEAEQFSPKSVAVGGCTHFPAVPKTHERNDAVLRKHMEREAALEARRNAQRSNISFAFGSSIPRNVETLHTDSKDTDIMSRSFTASGLTQRENYNTFHDRRSVSPLNYNGYLVNNESHLSDSSYSCTTYSERRVLHPPSWLSGSGALVGDDVMSKSMNAAMACAPRGRRKNDLMPTVPYERAAPARPITAPSTRKRSVSMTRLDQLAQPRRHYVEANKANSSTGSGASSVVKDNIRSPSRPLSSASEHSGGSGRVPGTVTRRVRSSPRKPRPVSIAGTLPDHKQISGKPFEVKVSPIKRSYTPSKKTTESTEVRKSTTQPLFKSSTPKPPKQVESKPAVEKSKPAPRPSTAPKASTSKPTTPKSAKQAESKPATLKPSSASKTVKTEPSTTKVKEKKSQPIKKKTENVVCSPATGDSNEKVDVAEKQNESAVTQEGEIAAENERNNAKRIISEEEAKAALAEKRRLAREQAEREAELERQRQEELRRQEEDRLRKEEEEQRKMEEEQLRLLEEHRRLEEEKLRKAIEEQEQKEEEERAKREEELRMKAEQERKAKEEAEKQRLELEEKLRKEEEERAERKKRLEKIMSRTRGKSSGTSPSGSISGSDQLDSGEHAQEGFSSGANSLDSNEAGEAQSEQASVEDNLTKAEISSTGDSMEANPTYEIGSENESLNSNELMMPLSETASQDNSLVIIPEKTDAALEPTVEATIASSVAHALETDPTVGMENQEEENMTFSQDVEIKSAITSEIEDKKLVDVVEEKNESIGSVAEIEPTFNSELQESVPVENFSESQSSQDMFVNEQQPSAETNLDEYLNETVPEGAENDALVDRVEKHEDSKEHTEDTMQLKDHAENVQFNEDTYGKTMDELSSVNDVLHSENNNEFMLPEPSSMPSNLSFGISGVDNNETDLSGMNRGSSVSSDIKLPDPIYETSDDGSISSEKHQQYYQQEDLGYPANQEVMSEDVFAEQVAPVNAESGHLFSDSFEPAAFAETENLFPAKNSEYADSSLKDNEFQGNFEETGNDCMIESMYQDKLLDALEQPREMGEENVIPSRSSTSSVVEADVHLPESELKQSDVFYLDIHENKENLNEFSTFSSELDEQKIVSTSSSAFYSDKENTAPSVETQNIFESSVTENNKYDLGPAGDGASINNPFSENLESHVFQGGDFNLDQQRSFSTTEQIGNIETLNKNELSSQLEQVSEVTLIKSDDNGAYVGIISSIDHDQSSNDFQKPNLHNEQLRNNYEFASMTDSEENSSLDSNLSQVMTVEKTESERITNEGLNYTENSTIESNSSQQVFSNGEQHNPFETQHIDYYDSNSKTNVNIFSASEMSNGHSLESSRQVSDQLGELHGYGQLDGNDILSVDHSKNNIFENVDAIDYGKVSPDPFLGKGNSKSGNPFLLQDDQKQVLMTPDFLN